MATSGSLNTSASAAAPVNNLVGQFLQIAKPPTPTGSTTTTTPQATTTAPTTAPTKPKMGTFAPKAEDNLLRQSNGNQNDVPGTFNGVGAFIDGYLRIMKRHYGARGNYNGG